MPTNSGIPSAQDAPTVSDMTGRKFFVTSDTNGAHEGNISLGDVALALDIFQGDSAPFYLVIAGQSNALGRGTTGSAVIPKAANPLVKVWNRAAGELQVWNLATNSSQIDNRILSDGTSGKGPTNNAYNMAWTMAHYIVKETGREVRVIVQAEGNESIDNFIPGTSGHWALLVSQLTAAGFPRIDSFLWQQGESNTLTDTQETYKTKLTTLVAQVKALSLWRSDSVFMAGTMSRIWLADNPTRTDLNETIVEVMEGSGPFFRAVDTGAGEVRSGDEVHFSGEGTVAGGRLYWDAYRSHFLVPAVSASTESASTTAQDRREIFEPVIVADFDPIVNLDATDAVGDPSNNDITSWVDRATGVSVTIPAGSPVNVASNAVAMQNAAPLTLVTALNEAQPFTVLSIVNFASPTTKNNVIIDGTGETDLLIFASGSTSAGALTAFAGTGYNSGFAPTGGTQVMVAVTFSGGVAEVFYNGVSRGTGPAGSNALGGTLYFGNSTSGASASNIRLHKIMVIPRVLTLTELKRFDAVYRGSY